MPAQIHSTSHESSRMAWAGVETGSKILVRCTGLSMLHISLLERANTLLRICYPRSPVKVSHPRTVVKYFNGNFPWLSAVSGMPGHTAAHVLTSRSNASKLVPLQGVAVPSPRCSTAVSRAVSSAGRALPSQGRGREFESPTVHRLLGQCISGRLAQRESAVFTRQKSQVQILYRPLGTSKG